MRRICISVGGQLNAQIMFRVISVSAVQLKDARAAVVPADRLDNSGRQLGELDGAERRRPASAVRDGGGLAPEAAAAAIRAMHGEGRIPTLLRRVDRACRW